MDTEELPALGQKYSFKMKYKYNTRKVKHFFPSVNFNIFWLLDK